MDEEEPTTDLKVVTHLYDSNRIIREVRPLPVLMTPYPSLNFHK